MHEGVPPRVYGTVDLNNDIGFARCLENRNVFVIVIRFTALPSVHLLSITASTLNGIVDSMSPYAARICPWRICVFGGYDEELRLKSAEYCNLFCKTWESLPPLGEPRAETVGVVAAGVAYICGGHDGSQALNSVESYDPMGSATGWKAVAPMRECRVGAVAGVISMRLIVAGGAGTTFDSESWMPSRSAEVFDFEAAEWRYLPLMEEGRYGAAGAVCGTQLYVCGGVGFDLAAGRQLLTTSCRFDLAGNAWEPLPPMPQPRSDSAAACIAGRIALCGGIGSLVRSAPPLNSTTCFDVASGTWVEMAPMSRGCYGARAVAVAGSLYICGGAFGRDSPWKCLNSIQRFDPKTEAWETMSPMMTRRAFAATVAMRF